MTAVELLMGALGLITVLALAALAFRPATFKGYPPIVRVGDRVGYGQEILVDVLKVRARVRGPEQIKFEGSHDYLRKYAGFKNFAFLSAYHDHQDWGEGMTPIWVVVLRPLSPALRFWNRLRGYTYG